MRKLVLRVAVMLSIFFAAVGFTTYTNLQKSEETVFTAWSDLDTSLQKRADLIPNLVNIAKGYMQHDEQTLEAVVAARAKATAVHLDLRQISDTKQVEKFVAAQQELQSSC